MELRSSFPDSLQVGLMHYYDDEYARYPQMYDRVFSSFTSTKNKEEISGSTGISKLDDVGENGAYTYEDELEDFKTSFVHRRYKKAIAISEDLADDDQYRSPESRIRKLASGAARTVDSTVFGVLRNAFTTTATSYGDGKPHCSTSHTRLDGGTARSNASATNVAISETSLETGTIAMDEALDHKGELMGNMGRGLILTVPIAKRKVSLEILKSPLRSGGNDNDLNYYSFGDWDLFVNPWIGASAGGSDTAFFLIRKENKSLKFFWRKPPMTRIDVDDETEAMKFKVRMRFSYGWCDPVGETWGSKGTGTGTYSS